MDDSLQQEARALGDPTRHRLFRYVAGASHPVGVAELTELLGLNHNSVRQHLAVLKAAGLVLEQVEDRSRPGRPRLLYRPHPEVSDRWGTSGAYPWLARLLAAAVCRKQDARQVGFEEGRRAAAEVSDTGAAVALLEQEMARRGFRPTRTQRGRRVDLVFTRCPFAEVADAEPSTVCQLHLGLAEGLADGLGGIVVQGLVAKRPLRARCRLIVHDGRPFPASA